MVTGGGNGAGPRPRSARELQAVIHAERVGEPFFVYRGPSGEQRIAHFEAGRPKLTIGRNSAADLSLEWDDQVSALHALIERQAGEFTLLDDGLSRNGSFVNEHAVHGMTRLRDGDMVRFGRTVALVRHPTDSHRNSTLSAPRPAVSPDLSDLQRAVLHALCRPLTESDALASPATNQVIANHLHLSVAAVKLHLRVLFEKFDVGHLPQNSKRLALAHRALDSGTLNHNRAR